VPDRGTRAPLLGLAAVLAVALVLRAPLLGGGQVDYDEGVYWQSLRAMAAGSPLFTAVYSSQPPAFLLLLLPAHLALGGGILADRLTVLVVSLAGVAAAGRTAWLLAGPWAGVLAAAVLAADPLFFRQSVTLQADGPAVALALVGVTAAAEARFRESRAAAVLAGAAVAVAMLTKLLAVAALPAAAVLLLAGRPPRVAAAAWAALGGLLAGAAVLLPFAAAWPDLWLQSVGLHLGARSLPFGGLDAGTLLRGLPVAVLGVAGGLVAVRRAPLLAAAGGAWAAAGAILLAAQHPLWPHHAVVLVPPLALLAGGLACLPARRELLAAGAVALLATSAASAAYVRMLQQPPGPAVAALRANTAPGDLVLTDDQYTAALADRRVPPELVDTSFVRVRSGDLTAEQVQAIAERDGVRAVLLTTGRLDGLPMREWAAQRYPRAMELGGGATLYLS
jgi:4-amino-4-deoxy-L-arabinose transferase-like glycosyltransferase